MPESPNGVYISMRDIYDELVKVKELIQTLNSSTEKTALTQGDHETKLGDLETRVRSIEKWRYTFPSIATIIAIVSLILAGYQAFGGK